MFKILHNLGLGDHIICNGMVRFLAHSLGSVGVFCKMENTAFIRRMYTGDEETIRVIPVFGDKQAEILKPDLDVRSYGEGFDQEMYRKAGMPFSLRWTAFRDGFYPAPLHALKEVFGVAPNMSYKVAAFWCSEGRYPLPPDLENDPSVIRVRQRKDRTLEDWVELASGASEIHCVDSAFFNLMQSRRFRPSIHLWKYRTTPTPTLGEGVIVHLPPDPRPVPVKD